MKGEMEVGSELEETDIPDFLGCCGLKNGENQVSQSHFAPRE